MNVGIDTDFLIRLAVLEHPGHATAVEMRDHHLRQGARFVLAPQVVSEFVHVVTDPRRFQNPLSMSQALEWVQLWLNAAEVNSTSPTPAALERFFAWMSEHNLGRKRILDTMLAATYVTAGINHLITSNSADYRIFRDLQLIKL